MEVVSLRMMVGCLLVLVGSRLLPANNSATRIVTTVSFLSLIPLVGKGVDCWIVSPPIVQEIFPPSQSDANRGAPTLLPPFGGVMPTAVPSEQISNPRTRNIRRFYLDYG